MSFKKNESGNIIYTKLCSPVHDVPLPVYAGLQVQLNDPLVSVQNASGSQSSAFVVHSLMSREDDAKLFTGIKAFQIFIISNSMIE